MVEPIRALVDGAQSGVSERPLHLGGGYQRHRPEETVLWRTLQAHWKTFLAEVESVADPPALPAFVVSEIEAFLRCGILAHGLVLARCRSCGWSRAVAFSCQRRGFCPSCIARRMCDFAARLVTDVVPQVPVRQWVLTVPHNLRVKLAIDPALTTLVLGEFIAAVTTWLRRRARRLGMRGELKTGAVTRRPGRFPWASLIWRVFLDDVLACVRCEGRMEIVAAVTSRASVEKILKHLGLPTKAPAFHAARPPPQAELPLDAVWEFEVDSPAPDDIGD